MELHGVLVISFILFAMGVGWYGPQQIQFLAKGIGFWSLTLGQKQTIEITGEANKLIVVDVRLELGVVALQSPML